MMMMMMLIHQSGTREQPGTRQHLSWFNGSRAYLFSLLPGAEFGICCSHRFPGFLVCERASVYTRTPWRGAETLEEFAGREIRYLENAAAPGSSDP